MYKKHPHCECFKRAQAYLFGLTFVGLTQKYVGCFACYKNVLVLVLQQIPMRVART
jgi:hypothetical protein